MDSSSREAARMEQQGGSTSCKSRTNKISRMSSRRRKRINGMSNRRKISRRREEQ